MANDDYDQYRSDVEDEKLMDLSKNNRQMHKDFLDEVEALRDENIEFRGGTKKLISWIT